MLNISTRVLRILRLDLDLVLDRSKHKAGSAPSVCGEHERRGQISATVIADVERIIGCCLSRVTHD